MTATTSLLDAYQVQVRRYAQWHGIGHLNITRRDQAPIASLDDVAEVKEHHIPGGEIHAVDLWVMSATPNGDDIDAEPAAPLNGELPSPAAAAAAAAAAARTPAATPAPARRRTRAPRHAGTLNLRRRETTVLDALLERVVAATEHGERLRRMFNLDDDDAQLLADVKDKLTRLPHDHVEADW